ALLGRAILSHNSALLANTFIWQSPLFYLAEFDGSGAIGLALPIGSLAGIFDVTGGIGQTSFPMRLKLILLLNLVCLTVRGADLPSVFNTNRTMRTLSLDECIRQALEHNLRIQIRRFDPNISRFQLEASRGI